VITRTVGDHTYHTEMPVGMQANDRLGHRTDWYAFCHVCTRILDIVRGDIPADWEPPWRPA